MSKGGGRNWCVFWNKWWGGWQWIYALVNQVLLENQSLFDRKLDKVMEEKSTLYRQEAREDVKDTMLLRDRALLFRKYKLSSLSWLISARINYTVVSKMSFSPNGTNWYGSYKKEISGV